MIRAYTIKTLDHRPAGLLARKVILGPLLGREGTFDAEQARTLQAPYDKLRGQYQRRLQVLRDAGLTWLQPTSGRPDPVAWMANCPPTGVQTVEGPDRVDWVCYRPSICPWCWCRMVAVPFYQALWGGNAEPGLNMVYVKGQADEAYPYRWFFARRSRLVRIGEEAALQIASLELDHEALWLKAMGSPGACLLAHVSAAPKGVRLMVCWAALWARSKQSPINWVRPDFKKARRIMIAPLPGPLDLVYQAARLVRFPAGMWYGPADRAVRILEQRGNHRLFRTIGACYRAARNVEAPPPSEEE